MLGRKEDITGRRFGRYTVIEYSHYETRARHWKCLCDCGNIRIVSTTHLSRGASQSCGCIKRDGKVDGGLLYLFKTYQQNAENHNREFTLELAVFQNLIQQACHYCGCQPAKQSPVGGRKYRITYNGIDRIDNKRGYVSDNVVPCCTICNRGKQSMDAAKWLVYLDNLTRHRMRFLNDEQQVRLQGNATME